MLIISSLTSPSPITFIRSEYFSFENRAVIVSSELTLIVNGFCVAPLDQPEKINPEFGVAVSVIVVPDLNDPPEVSTVPPDSDETSTSKKTDGASKLSFSSFTHANSIKKNMIETKNFLEKIISY